MDPVGALEGDGDEITHDVDAGLHSEIGDTGSRPSFPRVTHGICHPYTGLESFPHMILDLALWAITLYGISEFSY